LEPTDGFRTLEQALATTVEEPASRPGERAMLLAAMGELAAWLGDGARAVPLLEQCLVLAREAGHGTATALAQLWLSYTVAGEGELDRAKALATESLAWWRALAEPDWRRTGDALFALGYIASLRGHQHEAEARFTEGLVVARALGADISIAVGLESLGTCAREQGDQRRAAQLFAESLVLVRDGKDPFTIFTCLNSLGAVAAVTDRPEQAARLFGASEALRERHGVALLSADGLRLERAIAPARARLPEAAFAAAWADGRALPLEEAIAEALKVADDVAAPVLSEATAGHGSVQS
jgi:tetratricopeptide (TPR) repeat protein